MIKTVGIVGLGAVGGMYGKYLTDRLSNKNVRVIANQERIDRYKEDGVFCNNERVDYNFCYDDDDKSEPLDLIIIATKYHHLDKAIKNIRNYVGDNTLILSAINGIFSEEKIGEAYGADKVIPCVAQGMDSCKEGNKIDFTVMGKLSFGESGDKISSDRIKRVADFFDKTEFPYEIPSNMDKRMWGKFMLNVGLNQVSAVFDLPYGGMQYPCEARDTMLGAMREVMEVSKKADINLNEDDFAYWVSVNDSLTPDSMPSMRQDVLAKRKTEVEVFGIAVVEMGKKYKVETPINEFLVHELKKIENSYLD